MKIQVINKNDFNSVMKLWKKVDLPLAPLSREKREIELLIKYNPDTCLVIKENAKIIGTILGAFNGRRAWIHHLAIDPEYQKKGLGSILLNKTEKKLSKKGATKILLYISLDNLKVAPFYEKNGYSVMNDCIVMKKDLWNKK